MIDITKIKSAKVYETQNDVAEKLIEVNESRLKLAGPAPHTIITLRDDGRAFVGKKSLPIVREAVPIPGDQIKQWAIKAGITWDDAYADRAIPIWSSDERADRPGDIVMQNWVMNNYNANPLVLDSHDWDALPVGSTILSEVRTRVDGSYTGRGLYQVPLFASKQDYERADTVYRMMKAGFLRTVSVGFFPGSVIHVEDKDERAKMGLGRWGVIFDKNELIEVSPTSVPAHPRAGTASLLAAHKDGLLKASDGNIIREMTRREVRASHDQGMWKSIDENLRATWRGLFPDWSGKEHPDLDSPILNSDSSSRNAQEDDRIATLSTEVATLTKRVHELADEIGNSETRKVSEVKPERTDPYAEMFKLADDDLAYVNSTLKA